MFLAKIILVKGRRFTYLLRKVQPPLTSWISTAEELTAALQACTTTEQLLDYFILTDYYMDDAFMQLFEKRLRELEIDFNQPQSLN